MTSRQAKRQRGVCLFVGCRQRAVGRSIYCMHHVMPYQRSDKPRAVERARRAQSQWSTSVVYFFHAPDAAMVKIGCTTLLENRLAAVQACSPVKLSVFGTMRGGSKVEGWFHSQAAVDRTHGEWFRWTTRTRALIELLIAHGFEGAWDLCPMSYADDFVSADARVSRFIPGEQGDFIGDNCKCGMCSMFAKLEGR